MLEWLKFDLLKTPLETYLAVFFKSDIDMSGLLKTKNLDILDRSKSVLLIPKNAIYRFSFNFDYFFLWGVNYNGSWIALRGLSGDFYANPI